MDFDDPVSLILDKLATWLRAAIQLLPNVVVAILVVFVFIALARLARRAVDRLAATVTDNRQLHNLLTTIAYLSVLTVGLFIALTVVELRGVVTSILAGIGLVGLALGFAFQDLAANFIAGIMMAIRRPFKVGDVVETNDYMGVVEEVSIRSTRLRSFQGQEVRIPNSEVFANPLVNFSDLGSRRVDLGCGVAYGDDLERARSVAMDAVEDLDFVDSERGVDLFFTEFGDSSINFEVRFWVAFGAQTDYLRARSEAIMAVKAAFDANDITIPFPIRTLDFGVVGGEPLNEHWAPASAET